jgi:hypothetical protein
MTRDLIDARRLEFLTAALPGPKQDATTQERIVTAPTIMLLGGYANAGLQIARIVHAECDAHVILAGRNLPAARCPAGYHVAECMNGAR